MSNTRTPKGIAKMLEWAAGEAIAADKRDEWLHNIAGVLMDAAMHAEMEDDNVVIKHAMRRQADFASYVADELEELSFKGVAK